MDSLFLPFTAKGESAELTAIEVKRKLGVGPYDAVDPYLVLDEVPARLIPASVLDAVPDDTRRTLLETGCSMWSAVGIGRSPADERELILLNPRHHQHRQRVSLMEEIVHIIREHPRTRLTFNGDGSCHRPYDESAEDEAYNVGAACIIPYRDLFNRVSRKGQTAKQIAAQYSVSPAYVRFRIKRAGLYKTFQNRQKSRSLRT